MAKKPKKPDEVSEHRYCPTCGRPNPIQHSPEWLVTKFTGMLANMLAALIEARRERRTLSLSEMCYAAYPDARKGNGLLPVGAANTVAVCLTQNRARIQKHGWDIVGPRKTGAGYMLVALEN
jgi:hypothetical protein